MVIFHSNVRLPEGIQTLDNESSWIVIVFPQGIPKQCRVTIELSENHFKKSWFLRIADPCMAPSHFSRLEEYPKTILQNDFLVSLRLSRSHITWTWNFVVNQELVLYSTTFSTSGYFGLQYVSTFFFVTWCEYCKMVHQCFNHAEYPIIGVCNILPCWSGFWRQGWRWDTYLSTWDMISYKRNTS